MSRSVTTRLRDDGGVTDPTPADRATERARLDALLRRLGATEQEINEAFATGSPAALAVAAAIRAGRPRVDPEQAAAAAGLDDAEFAELLRALGLSTPSAIPGGLPPPLADALPVIALAAREWLGPETGLGLSRVIGGVTAQLAEAVVDAFRVEWEVPELAAGASYSEVVERYVEMVRASLPSLEGLVTATFEAHLLRVAAGAWAPDEQNAAARRTLFVGFADLVGYTALSRTLNPAELSRLLGTFEQIAGAAVTGHGGRLVKQIGDGAMFVTDAAADGCAAALEICERMQAAELPPVRVGADVGPVLSRYGDYFGEVVNRAARLVALAAPGTVVVTGPVVDALGPGWTAEQLPARALKGFQAPAVTYRLLAG
jgi:class 3 adenylate cyclase